MNFHQAYFEPTSRFFGLGLLRTPGYPAFIRAVYSVAGPRPWVLILAQIAIGVATVWLVYLLSRRLFGRGSAPWAALALAVDPISIIFANTVQPEVLFTLLLAGGSLLWLRGMEDRSWGWGAAGAILLGFGALVRPIEAYLPVILVPVSLLLYRDAWKKRIVFALAVLLAFSIPVGGWVAHNAQATGVPILSTVESINLLEFRAAGALASDEGISLEQAQAQLRQKLARRTAPDLNDAERSRVAAALAAHTLLQHPVGAVKTWARGAALMLGGPGRDELLRHVGISSRTGAVSIALLALEFLVYVPILAGSAWGIVVLIRKQRWFQLVLVLALIVYFLIVSSGPEAYSRFRVPIAPFLALLAGCGFYAAVSPSALFSPRAHQ
jgi:4-amino-4-deoxy-L-arabinose transferase-like glycosyltransferase